jgi:hypothetical protein
MVPDEAPLADFERRAKENENLFEQVKKKLVGIQDGLLLHTSLANVI